MRLFRLVSQDCVNSDILSILEVFKQKLTFRLRLLIDDQTYVAFFGSFFECWSQACPNHEVLVSSLIQIWTKKCQDSIKKDHNALRWLSSAFMSNFLDKLKFLLLRIKVRNRFNLTLRLFLINWFWAYSLIFKGHYVRIQLFWIRWFASLSLIRSLLFLSGLFNDCLGWLRRLFHIWEEHMIDVCIQTR